MEPVGVMRTFFSWNENGMHGLRSHCKSDTQHNSSDEKLYP